jgi:anion transporter
LKTTKLSIIGTIILSGLGIYIGIFLPWEADLSVYAHRVLMILLITVGMWIFKPFDISLSLASLFMLAAFIVIGVPLSYIFSGFTSAAVWTLIPALLFGHVIIKTGLGKRIALLLLKQFKPSYRNLIIIFTLVVIILSILTPSITVRISVILPVALGIVEVCGLKGNSKEGAFILLTTMIVAMIPGTGWLTGSLYGPVTLGMYESVPDLQGLITFNSWAMVNLLPAVLITALVILGGYLVLKPKNNLNVSNDTFVKKYQELGKCSSHEKKAAVVFTLCFILFLTGGFELHPIPVPAIVLGAVFVLALSGVVKQGDISVGINWDNVIFVGSALGLIMIFGQMEIAGWVGDRLIPILTPISGSPWLFIYVTIILLFIWRFFDITTLVLTKAILIPTLPLISQELGINPLIWIPIFIITGNAFFLSYTNSFILIGRSVVADKGWSDRQEHTYGMIYALACLIAITILIPYWMAVGVL